MKNSDKRNLIFGSEQWFDMINQMESHWIYRYRPYTPVALKELMYSEIYFAYGDELNDPLDLYADLIIKKGDNYILTYLIKAALKSVPINRRKKDLDINEIRFSEETVKGIIADDVLYLKLILEDSYKSYFQKKFIKHKLDKKFTFNEFYSYFYNVIMNLFPQNLCSVSFSKKYDNPVLWSNFSNGHYGFCLIFSPSSDTLRLKKKNSPDYKDFKCHRVSYDNDKTLDLSLLFDKNDMTISIDNVFSEYLPIVQSKVLLKKLKCYKSENEIRIHGSYGVSFPSRIKDWEKETSFDRIYHYDINQLVGVVLGIKLSEQERLEIKSILKSFNKGLRLYEAYLDCGFVKTRLIQIN